MSAGPLPVPAGVRLGAFTHGDTVTFPEALECASRPEFPDSWAIVPDTVGDGLRLMWADACTTAELERCTTWNVETVALIRASDTPRGSA